MKIEIVDLWRNGRTIYYWKLWDGPDGIDTATGYAVSLEEAVAKILQWRERIGLDYIRDILEEGEGGGGEVGA